MKFSFYQQVTGKLNHAQIGMYFIYLGAVSGSRGFIYCLATASLINLDILPDDDSGNAKRSLKELFVRYRVGLSLQYLYPQSLIKLHEVIFSCRLNKFCHYHLQEHMNQSRVMNN